MDGTTWVNQVMKLTEHFTLEEMTRSFEGARKGINNELPSNMMGNIVLSAELMEEVRAILGKPVQIHSCYRSPAVNKLVGGKPSSMHLQALAVDFVCPEFGTPAQVAEAILARGISFGKMIYEFDSWIHIQPGTERKVFTINEHGTFAGIRL